MLGYFVLSKSVGQVDASTQRLWNALILGLIIIFSITLIIIIRFAQGITLPIEKITRIVEEITSFNFSSRAIEHDQDEIGKLGQAINTMSQSLDQQLQRIFDDENRFKTVLDNMITGIIMLDADYRISLLNKQAEKMIDYDKKYLLGQSYTVVKHPLELPILIDQCLQTKTGIREELTIYYPYERIVELNIVPLKMLNNEICGMMIMIHDISIIRKLEMMRREFVANVSHEIKTPLTALKGFAETLLAGAIDERETARSFLQIIYNEANRLNRLITDILQLSKMESGQYKLQFSAIELKPFFEKVELMMVTQAKQKSILLRLNVPDGLFIEADEDLLMQIMINLVTNAINYTPHGGRVVIRAQYADSNLDRILFEVSDTGIGIPKQDQERIFERFYRVDKARSRESGGTGLGLSIVKHLVELHQGIITVESQTDTGSTFKIIFPLIQ
jgi:two-component system phosphate regulon sensor histidine kinase PhoR